MDAGLREKAQNVSFIAAAVGLVAGLVLACYASYLEHNTGATILEQPVVEGQAILMDLDPEMNPVHLRWSGQVGSSRRWREALFGASLMLGDRAIWNGEVSMWARRAVRSMGEETGAIATVDVPEAGRYAFTIDRTSADYREANVGDLRIEVKRNTRVAPEWCLPVGIGLLIAGFVFGGIAVMLEKKEEKAA